jgi:hypothetical protein
VNLTGIGRMASQQVFQVAGSIHGPGEPAGHDAQSDTYARQQKYRREG